MLCTFMSAAFLFVTPVQAWAPLAAISQQTTWLDRIPAMPPHTSRSTGIAEYGITKVELKPDLDATAFSTQNALYFAKLSKIAYESKEHARGLIMGNSTYEGLGFDRFHWFEGGEEARKNPFDAIHDTEAFVAANDDLIAIVFRGTKTIDNWWTNFMLRRRPCPPAWGLPHCGGEVHQGFDDGVNTVWECRGMYDAIKTLYNEEGKARKLFVAGHSLGGALATIAGARLAFEDNFNITGIYTIGSPRLFDWRAARYFDSKLNHGTPLKAKYFRCKNNQDVVTTVPGCLYAHVGTEIFLDQYGTLSISSMADRLLDQLLWCIRLEIIKGVNDHATSEYIRLFTQILANSRVSLLEKASSVVMDSVARVVETVAPAAMENSQMMQDMKKRRAQIDRVKEMAREAASAREF